MFTAVYQKIRSNPKFGELVSRRSRFAWTLSAVVLAIYFAFVFVVAFNPGILAAPLAAGLTTTWAIPIGVGILILFWLLTATYVRRANSDFDAINADILKEAIK